MLCTIYAKTVDGVDAAQCRLALAEFYKDEYFVKVCEDYGPAVSVFSLGVIS